MSTHIPFFTRLRMALSVMRQKNFSITIKHNQREDELTGEEVCDNNRRASNCDRPAAYCLRDLVATFKIEWQGHYHVCEPCAKQYEGKDFTQDWD